MTISASQLFNTAFKQSNNLRRYARSINLGYRGEDSIPVRGSDLLRQLAATFTVAAIDLRYAQELEKLVGTTSPAFEAEYRNQNMSAWPLIAYYAVDGGGELILDVPIPNNAASGTLTALRALLIGTSYPGNAETDPVSALLAFAVADWVPTP